MTNSQYLILFAVLVIIYLYLHWKKQAKFTTDDLPPEFPSEQKDWFTDQHWLTDAEIDWAMQQLAADPQFKILPAYQFYYVQEAPKNEAEAHLALPELLKELNTTAKLVFIPINQPNYHWSLLVYETSKRKFYHYDTSQGANDAYIKPLVKELLHSVHQRTNLKLNRYLRTNYDIQQGNGYDCGIAVISLMERIMEKQSLTNLGSFDFPHSRQEWRTKLINHD